MANTNTNTKKTETVNKDGSITMTSQDGQYSVTYKTNRNGVFTDEWDDFDDLMDRWDSFAQSGYDNY